MKRTVSYLPVVLLVAVLFSLVSIPDGFSNRLRSFTVASFVPFWSSANRVSSYLADRPLWKPRRESVKQIDSLALENALYKTELEVAYDWILSEKEWESQFQAYKGQKPDPILLDKMHHQYLSVSAMVIYRDPTSWSSSLWINLGEKDNESKKVIEKNSPVLSKGSLIGVVDYVGRKHSRVRLLTDAGVSTAVRVARGNLQNRHLTFELETLKTLLERRDDLFISSQEKALFLAELQGIEDRLKKDRGDLFLAKGELFGSSSSLWRANRPFFKGVGFNFEFPDEEGTLGFKQPPSQEPILKEGDLLVTSGLDGVFPPGLMVGTVTKVEKREGYAYAIEAQPTAVDFNHLQLVFVLPSLGNE